MWPASGTACYLMLAMSRRRKRRTSSWEYWNKLYLDRQSVQDSGLYPKISCICSIMLGTSGVQVLITCYCHPNWKWGVLLTSTQPTAVRIYFFGQDCLFGVVWVLALSGYLGFPFLMLLETAGSASNPFGGRGSRRHPGLHGREGIWGPKVLMICLETALTNQS